VSTDISLPCGDQAEEPASAADDTGIGVNIPNVARMYDYWLGGKDNFKADRVAADRITAMIPGSGPNCLDNRSFLQRAVRFLAEAGIRQFVDIGSGLPTAQNTHQVAHEIDPGIRVAYIDYDPVVISHARALLATDRSVIAVHRDLRSPRELIEDEGLGRLIDFREPVALLLVAVLHFVENHEEVAGVLKDRLAPGSFLALTHVTADHVPRAVEEAALEVYKGASAQLIPRSNSDITGFLGGLEIMDPGVVEINSWHPEILPCRPVGPAPSGLFGAVARKI